MSSNSFTWVLTESQKSVSISWTAIRGSKKRRVTISVGSMQELKTDFDFFSYRVYRCFLNNGKP